MELLKDNFTKRVIEMTAVCRTGMKKIKIMYIVTLALFCLIDCVVSRNLPFNEGRGNKKQKLRHQRLDDPTKQDVDKVFYADDIEWELDSGPWLEEFEETAKVEKEDIDYMQGDDPGRNKPKPPSKLDINTPMRCPDVPVNTNDLACDEPKCANNTECTQPFHLCCSNGCVYTCMEGVRDSPVIDWEVQPVAIDPDRGPSWLIHDDRPQNYDSDRHQLVDLPHCIFERMIIPDGKDFVFEGHPCSCFNGEVFCNVLQHPQET